MTDLNGKTIVITGASSGLGEATARDLAAAGMKVMLAARRADRLQTLQSEIVESGGVAQVHVTDVTDRASVQAAVDATVAAWGRVDAIFNNAGVMLLAPLEKRLVDEWDQMIDVNIKGVLYGVSAVLPHMRKQGSGHIINCASIAGHRLIPSAAVYCATKYAVRALSEGLRMEVGGDIRCTIISPGAVATELPEHISDPDTKAAIGKAYDRAITPDAIARAVRFALTEPADVDVNEIVVRPTLQEM